MVGITEKEKELVTASWGVFKKDLKTNGMDTFITLFTMRPDFQDYFDQFRGLSLDEVAKSTKLRAHGSIFMHSMSSIIDNLDDIECAAEILRKKVQSHYPRGVRKEHYESLFMVVWPEVLKKKLGNQLDEAMADAWTSAANLLMSVIEDELEILRKANENAGE